MTEVFEFDGGFADRRFGFGVEDCQVGGLVRIESDAGGEATEDDDAQTILD